MKETLKCFVLSAWALTLAPLQTYCQMSLSTEGQNFLHIPRKDAPGSQAPLLNGRFRTIDGTLNNIQAGRTDWGATDIQLERELPAIYGISDPLNALGGDTRPSPRKISNELCDEPETIFNSRGLSAFVYVWGQFLDHDINLTPTGTTESAPVALPANETLFTLPIPFQRSEVFSGTGKNRRKREQINLITAWVDASNVYGSEISRANWLRTFREGKLKVSDGDLLPYNTLTGQFDSNIDPNAPSMANDKNKTVKTFVAGDIRASEHPALISLHTLFVREHNKICDRLKQSGVTNDEELYQLARKEVGALVQQVTYNEFLPALGVALRPYRAYNPNARPDILNTFATAAFRFGHSMVADDILLIDNECHEYGPGEFDLLEVFWNPQLVKEYGIQYFLKGLATHKQYETDLKVNSVLRNFLFGDPTAAVRFGLDLAAVNIQRGRDHGLPDYNSVRRFYLGSPARYFSDITSDAKKAESLRALYGSISNIDLWVGLLAEDNFPGKSVGRTAHEMLRVQFENLRDGDFYYFLNDPYLPTNVKTRVQATKLSDLLKRNTGIGSFQTNVFIADECPGSAPPAVALRSNESSIEGIRVFPNPVSDVLKVDLGHASTAGGHLLCYALDGKLIMNQRIPPSQQYLEMSVSGFPEGVYIIKIVDGEKSAIQRVLVQRE